MLLLAVLLGCSRPDAVTRWVHVTPWDPLSEELLACVLPEAPSVRWVAREADAVPGAVALDAPGVPEFADSRVGRVVTDDGRTWVVWDCDTLRATVGSSPPPPQGAATLELLALDFSQAPPGAIEAASLRTDELDDPELLGQLALELAYDPDTAPIALRLARRGLELEQRAERPDPLVLASLKSDLATALWTVGTGEAREEAVELQRKVVTARGTSYAWSTLHRYEQGVGRPLSERPGPVVAPPATAARMAEEVRQLTARLRGELGRWSPALEASLDQAEREIAVGAGKQPEACVRVQRALEKAYDAHFGSACRGQRHWVPATERLRAIVAPDLEPSGPLPDPLSVKPGVPYPIARLGEKGDAATGTVVFQPPGDSPTPPDRPRGWSLELRSEDGLPATAVLSVSTLMEHELFTEQKDRAAFLATASEASGHPVVVVDLRGNGGGSYAPAYQWLEAFSDVRHTTPGTMSNRRAGWRVRDQSTLDGEGAPLKARVYILIDGDTASAGEAFAVLLRQLPGARLVGMPTRGVLLANGATSTMQLPQLQMQLKFGDTAFAWDHLHPFADGVGMFPDLWYLDDSDAVEAVRRHAAGG